MAALPLEAVGRVWNRKSFTDLFARSSPPVAVQLMAPCNVSEGVATHPTMMLQGSYSTNTKAVYDSVLLVAAMDGDIDVDLGHLKEAIALCNEPLVLHQIISN
ncbi:hypothetical protein M9H77_17700 [Catharanthus roseus]|uniref:Uncharacterized protein n=1 Tax=Catharanthus roseus TaxID=4058 RepID=A0ACC0B5C1_CATRO|nr:hypothetical protein M9H77_17700 [Catharanthus roseus]